MTISGTRVPGQLICNYYVDLVEIDQGQRAGLASCKSFVIGCWVRCLMRQGKAGGTAAAELKAYYLVHVYIE